jgi:hypothetical protein
MSDVLNGLDTPSPIEELNSSSLEDVAEVQSLNDKNFAATSANRSLLISVLAPRVIRYLERACVEALRSTCKEWRTAIDRDTPPHQSASYCMPTEILQNIYKYLGPRSVSRKRGDCDLYSSRPVQCCSTYLPPLDAGELGSEVTMHYA